MKLRGKEERMSLDFYDFHPLVVRCSALPLSPLTGFSMLEMTIESQAAKISAGNILLSFVKISDSIYLA